MSYCIKCGNQINNNDKYCGRCGAVIQSKKKTVSTEKIFSDTETDRKEVEQMEYEQQLERNRKKFPKIRYFIATIVLIVVMFFAIKSAFIALIHIGDNDLDRMVGYWREEDGSRAFMFYKPYSDINGDIEYYKSSGTYYGSYEWHEASKRIIVTVIDNWDTEESMSFQYYFMDSDHLILSPLDDSYSSISLKKRN